MSASTYVEVQAAAELAILGMALRAYLARECGEEPEVVSVRVEASRDKAEPSGSAVVLELIDRNGMAIGGLTL